MKNFKVKTIYKTNTVVEEIVSANTVYGAINQAHAKALKQPSYIKTVFVYNEFGHLAGGFDRSYGKLKTIFG